MTPPRAPIGIAALALLALTVGFWTWREAEQQRTEIERALRGEAVLLAAALAPGLSSAADALLEIDDANGARLLDNARLLASLVETTGWDRRALLQLLEANELDTIAVLAADGAVVTEIGAPIDAELRGELAALLRGSVTERLLSSSAAAEPHRAALVRRPRGGAVLVSVDATPIEALSRRVGVEGLLLRLVRSPGVLYLDYVERPGDEAIAVSWDGGPVPAARELEGPLRQLRDRLAFEVEVPVEAPAGRSARLRVGLDGGALARASRAATRRTLLVGLALTGFAFAAAGWTILRSERARERAAAEERLRAFEEQRLRSERLALAGALTAGLAHEVRSPLNAISLAVQRLERAELSESARATARLVRDEVRRLEGTLREFLELARPGSGRRDRVELEKLAEEVADLLAPEAAEAGIGPLVVRGAAVAEIDRESVRRALLNLARNAIQASPENAPLAIEVNSSGDGGAELRVLDRGRGLPPELLERALEPFVTTRADGTGLGLALVRRVAEEHGGEVRLENRPGGGVAAILTLPRPTPASPGSREARNAKEM